MPAGNGSTRGADVVIEIQEDGAGKVTCGVLIPPRWTGERPAQVHDPQVGVRRVLEQPRGGDDRSRQGQHDTDDRAAGGGTQPGEGDPVAGSLAPGEPDGAGVGVGGASPGRAASMARFCAVSVPISRNTYRS